MSSQNHTIIGIWGCGKTGFALADYFLMHTVSDIQIIFMDRKNSYREKIQQTYNGKAIFFSERLKEKFFTLCSFIFVSQGVDIRKDYQTFKYKMKTELDFFYSLWGKKIIGITGSIGKTSVTSHLNTLLDSYNISKSIGGNIGIPIIELLPSQKESQYALLEVSSFQLEYISNFSPDLAIITNLFENHLDRHETMEQYFSAKYNIIRYQNNSQKALVPLNLYKKVMMQNPSSAISVFALNPTLQEYSLLKQISNQSHCFIMNNHTFSVMIDGKEYLNLTINKERNVFPANIAVLAGALFLIGSDLNDFDTRLNFVSSLENRIEYCGTYNNVSFYNDSKSTTMQSTIAAVEKFSQEKIFLFLGGLSKGVNRASLLQAIKNKVSFIACFGNESQELYDYCFLNGIPADSYPTLEEACKDILKIIEYYKISIVLFSPSGSSYDLFADYQERGIRFKNLICNLIS